MARILDDKLLELNVRVQMGRPHGGRITEEEDYFHLELQDEKSGLLILEGYFSVNEFADMLSNRSTTGKVKLYPHENIGKQHEHQTVWFDLDDEYGSSSTDVLEKKAVEWEAANPGWSIDRYNIRTWNSHNYQRKGKKARYHVTARRWV